jgi:hypothetical protein
MQPLFALRNDTCIAGRSWCCHTLVPYLLLVPDTLEVMNCMQSSKGFALKPWEQHCKAAAPQVCLASHDYTYILVLQLIVVMS